MELIRLMFGFYRTQQRKTFHLHNTYQCTDFHGNLRLKFLLHAYDSVPYDKATIFGFSVTLMWQELGAISISIIFALKITLFLSFYLFYAAFIADIVNTFDRIDSMISERGNNKTPVYIKAHLVDIMDLHVWSARCGLY